MSIYTYTHSSYAVNSDDKKEQPKKAYIAYEQTFTAQQLHFYISDVIHEPCAYTDMIHRIAMAGPSDVIYIHLNTPGGRLDTGVQMINAMQNSQAKIVTVLESVAHSLGTLIFLAGDEMIVNDHCLMMFHNFRGVVGGKGQELVAELDATIKWFSTLAKKIYIPFLSEDEFNRMSRGEDIWMQSTEIRKRLERMVKELEEEQAEPKPKPRAKKPKAPEGRVVKE